MTSSPSWTKRLRDRLQAEFKKDPQLAGEASAEKRARRPSIITIVLVALGALITIPALGLAFPLVLLFDLKESQPAFVAVVVSGFMLTVAVFAVAEVLLAILHRSKAVSVFSHLPADDSHIARDRWKLLMLFSLAGLWYLASINLGILRGAWSSPWAWIAGIAISVSQWGSTLGVGTWLAYRFPRWRHGMIGYALFLLGIFCAYLPDPVKEELAEIVVIVCPGCWPGGALWATVHFNLPRVWLAAVPALVVTLLLPKLVKTFCVRFTSQGFTIRQRDEVRMEFGGDFAGAAERRIFSRSDATEPDDVETDEEFAREFWKNETPQHDWIRRGWMERLVARVLTDREKSVVTFLTGNVTYWTNLWRYLFAILAIVMILLIIGVFPFEFGSLDWLPFVATVLIVSHFFGESYPGFKMTDCSGAHVAHQANYPLSTEELSKTFLKIACVRGLFLSLLVLPVLLKVTLLQTVLSVVGAFSAFMVIYIWRLTVHLSRGLALPRLGWTNFWLVLIPVALAIGTVIGFGLHLALIAQFKLKWLIGLPLSWGCSLLNFWFFKRMIDRSEIDLISSRLSWLDQLMNSNVWQEQQWQKQAERYERLYRQYGTFWWLRRPFG